MSPLPSAERGVSNPFGSIVGKPLEDREVDVAEINAAAFEACQRLVREVAAGRPSAALTVVGDSGTGKSHLLGRVRRWLESQPRTLFVFVRMETSAAGIWRHLRRCLALAVLRAAHAHADAWGFQHRRGELETLPNRDLSIVLEHLMDGRRIRDSAAWLRGEGLPEEALSALGLASPGPDDDPEAASRHVVKAICEWIAPGAVVLCMDQIEAVMSSPEDRDGPHAVGKAVSFLVEETHNVAVICCQQSSFVNLMERILDTSAKDKMLRRRAGIAPLSWEQAEQLIAARLDTVPELAERRAAHGGCWPLPESQIRQVFQANAAPARAIIARCKDLFDEWQTGIPAPPAPPPPFQEWLDARYATKDPGETEAILRNGMPLLARSAGLACAASGERSPLDFTLDGGRISVAIRNEENLRSLASHLRKLTESWKPAANQKLLLLRDARLPISRSAAACHQRIANLKEHGGRLIAVSQEAVEALAALRRLLADAEGGDLSHRGTPIQSGAVEQWIAGNLPASLDPLLEEFALGEFGASAPRDLTPLLAALLAERKMVTLEDAARSLEVPPGEVEACARRDPRQFGVLGGKVPALFQPVAPVVEAQ